MSVKLIVIMTATHVTMRNKKLVVGANLLTMMKRLRQQGAEIEDWSRK